MFQAVQFTKDTDRSEKKNKPYYIARILSEHEQKGECLRLAAFLLQKESFDYWEHMIADVLCGTPEQIAEWHTKLGTMKYKVVRGEIVKVKEKSNAIIP